MTPAVVCSSSNNTSHLALDIADRAYVLSHGNLVQQGTVAELTADRGLLEASYLGEQAPKI